MDRAEIRSAISRALGLSAEETVVTMTDYSGATIRQSASFMTSKLLKDIDHAAYAGWLRMTLASPIEVWDRIHEGTMKRHYFSAYGSKKGNVVFYVAAAVSATGVWVTSFHKESAAGFDSKRNGTLIYRCYG